MTEFELIDLFTGAAPRRGEGVLVGIGDDAALLRPPRGEDLVVTVDAVVERVHFDGSFRPEDVGWKALAVNLSDLAAMGARPLWALCALATPADAAPARLRGVGRGLARCARAHGTALVGGNVTRARDLSLTVTVVGAVRRGRALRRGGADAGDVILVSGTIGDAALGVMARPSAPALARLRSGRTERISARAESGGAEGGPFVPSEGPGAPGVARSGRTDRGAVDPAFLRRQRRPQPRLALGRALAGIASAGIDLSDGLVQDLGHVCEASGTGAVVEAERLPLSHAYRRWAAHRAGGLEPALAGGEDYELLVTVAPARLRRALASARAARVPLTAIGTITAGRGVEVRAGDGSLIRLRTPGHDHLRPPTSR